MTSASDKPDLQGATLSVWPIALGTLCILMGVYVGLLRLYHAYLSLSGNIRAHVPGRSYAEISLLIDFILGLCLAFLLIKGGALLSRRNGRATKFLLPAAWGGLSLLLLVILLDVLLEGRLDHGRGTPQLLTILFHSFVTTGPFLLFLGIFLCNRTISAHVAVWREEQMNPPRFHAEAGDAAEALARMEPAESSDATDADDPPTPEA